MVGWWRQLGTLLRLARVPMTFSAISNAWLAVFVSGAITNPAQANASLAELPLWAALTLAAAAAAGLSVYGAALNDVLDLRHDRMFRPQRPIAAGLVRRQRAAVVAVVSLLIAILAAVGLGELSILFCLLAAGGIVFYNTLGKHLPATGVLTLALIRCVSVLMVNPRLGLMWPLALMLVHTTATTAVVNRMLIKRPAMDIAAMRRLGAGLIAVLLLGGWWLAPRSSGLVFSDVLFRAGPLAAALLFPVVALLEMARQRRLRRPRRAVADSLLRISLLWLMVYDVAWLLSAGLLRESAITSGLLFAALSLGGLSVLATRRPSPDLTYLLGDRRARPLD